MLGVHVIASVTGQHSIEKSITIGQVRVAADGQRGRYTETFQPRRREIADLLRYFDAVNIHAQIVKKRHVATVAEAKIQYPLCGILAGDARMAGILSEKRANDEFNWIDVSGAPLVIECVIRR